MPKYRITTDQGVYEVTTDDGPAQPQSSPTAQEYSVSGFLGNAIDSASNMLGGLYQTVRHPINTASNLVDLGAGLADQGLVASGLSQESNLKPSAQRDLAKVRGVENFYKQRYGGGRNIVNTAYTDPVGLLGDVSVLLGGTGAVLRGGATLADAANAGRISSGLLAAGDAATAAGGLLNPVSAPGRAVRSVASRASGPLAERMYMSALKPSNKLSQEQKVQLANTGLSGRVPVSNSGLAKSDAIVDELNNQISQKIKAGSANGDTIDPQAVATRADQVKLKFANQVNPSADLRAIDASRDEFLANHTVPIPVDDAQAIKQGTYQQIRKSYGSLSGAQVEAQKALARGIKEELAAKYPELSDLNASDSRMIALNGAIEKAIGRINNHQLLGIGTPLTIEAAKAATGSHPIAMLSGVARAIIDDPAIKSHIAIAMRGLPRGAPGRLNGLLNVGQRSNVATGLLAQ